MCTTPISRVKTSAPDKINQINHNYPPHNRNRINPTPKRNLVLCSSPHFHRETTSLWPPLTTSFQQVETFLNLPRRFTPWNFYFNETKGFYCLRNETVQKCLPPSKGRNYPVVSAHLMSKLRQYFAPFNDHFYELIGQNFSWATS